MTADWNFVFFISSIIILLLYKDSFVEGFTDKLPPQEKVCRNTNDILLEGTCYVCGHYKNSFVNPDTLQCNSIVKAYAPSKSYTLKDANGTCDTGYVRDNGTCYQCLGQDRYINGRCNEVIASLPQYTYNAIDSQIDFQTRSRRSTRL